MTIAVTTMNVNRPLHLFGRFVAAATLFLLVAGAAVTSTDSGLAVPDWPKSYGMWMPPMVGGIFYEHGHRMVATFVGFLSVVYAVWLGFAEPRAWVRRTGYAALATVIVQGLLGGLTVKLLLPTWVSTFHASLAQTFFCLVVALMMFTGPAWSVPAVPLPATPGRWPLSRLGMLSTGTVFVQLILGAVMRHSAAGLAIPDFPLAFGRLVPPLEDPRVQIHFAHRVWALVVTVVLFVFLRRLLKLGASHPDLRRLGVAIHVLLPVQLALGAAAVLTQRSVPVTVAHLAVGALILAVTFAATILAIRSEPAADTPLPEVAIPA